MPAGCAGLGIEISGELQTDGLSHLGVTLRAAKASSKAGTCVLSNVQLVTPLREAATRLINGFGWKGARRPGGDVSLGRPC